MKTKPIVYDVWTDADRDEIEAVALDIFREWVAWAEGKIRIGGKFLLHPTGRYASALRLDIDRNHVAIIADESVAPEAYFLEIPRGPVDLKEYAPPLPRHIRMHRGGGVVARAADQPQPKLPRAGLSPAQYRTPKLIARRRAQYGKINGSEWATLTRDQPEDSWIIPAMPAYQPGHWLAEEARKRLGGGRG